MLASFVAQGVMILYIYTKKMIQYTKILSGF